MGPGSLYTSVIPHLLVEGIPQAIAASPAVKAYFTNLMTQPGETTAHVRIGSSAAYLRSTAARGALVDTYACVNTGPIMRKALEHYEAERGRPVENDDEKIEAMGVRVVQEDLCASRAGGAGEDPARSRAPSAPSP